MTIKSYEVVVKREGRWWVFDIPELGTGGQARNLAELDTEAQGVAAMWLDIPPEKVAIRVTISGPEHALKEWALAEREELAANAARSRAAAHRRAAVRELREQRYTAEDVGRIFGVSRQRINQLDKAR